MKPITIWARVLHAVPLALLAALLPGPVLADLPPAPMQASPVLAAPISAVPVAVPAPHLRVLPLQGGRNFRDLGGYRTTDGHHVKWGLLFRSGSMHGLTPADYTYLEGRGIQVVCDFRSTAERTSEPANWPADHDPVVLSEDYALMSSAAIPKGDMRQWDAEQARVAVAATYPAMLQYFAGQYRRMFAALLAGHAPLAFNCSAGKDRTGVAAALLLTALGVPRHTVIEDYLLTNTTLDSAAMIKASSGAAAKQVPFPAPVLAALLTADRSYIEAALHALDAHQGGANGYFRDELQLSPADIRHLRALYLER